MKISIIGAGNVGSALANILYRQNKFHQIILIDRKEDFVKGVGLDIMHSAKSNTILQCTTEYQHIKNSDIIITCAGQKRSKDMTRQDLLQINQEIITNIAQQVYKFAPKSKNIIVTNPVDILTYTFYKSSKLDKKQIIGMAGTLDTNRFKYLLSQELNCPISDISTFVIGEHGNNMMPLLQYTAINNIPLIELIENNTISNIQIKKIIQKLKNSGLEIIQLRETSAFYSTASSIVELIDAFTNYQPITLTGSAICTGEYSLNDIAIGMPIKINYQGVQIISNLNLNSQQQEYLINSTNELKKFNIK